MKVLISGASGFLGSLLIPALEARGHTVMRLGRSNGELRWNPSAGELHADLSGIDAIINLAGENIGSRWSSERKRRIRDSRVIGTNLLGKAAARAAPRPAVFISASAVGIYGDRGEEMLTEESAPGTGFLADVGREWEAAAQPAREAGIRTVHPRFGVILHPRGGALKKMLLPFSLGLGGRLGSGRQYMSWVSADDAVNAVLFALEHSEASGPINVTAPAPVTNAEFTAALARTLGRPAFFHVPAFALRAVFGEMADAALLSSVRAIPLRLQRQGFVFVHERIESAFQSLLTWRP